jgi:CDGSH-type Zn-finger protein
MAEVKIQIRNNGPYRVTGPIDIIDAEGNPYNIPAGQWVSLCRCGQSSNKPFCDATHQKVSFNAPSKAR